MAQIGKCPYCKARCVRVSARVVRQPSHLAFGYGERLYRCGRCGSEHYSRYAIPPKGIKRGMPKPNPGILHVTIREGISGFASPIVLTAENPHFRKALVLDVTEHGSPEMTKESAA